MTNIKLKRDGDKYCIELSGHSRCSNVCSAISHTVYSLAEYLEKGTKRVKILTCEFGDAFTKIEFCGGTEAEEIFNLVATGLLLMKKEMGEFINIL